MRWPQIVIICLLVARCAVAIARDEKRKVQPQSFISALFQTALWVGLLYAGGFWG